MKMLVERIKAIVDVTSPSAYHNKLKAHKDLMAHIEESWDDAWGDAKFKTKLYYVYSGESPLCVYGKVRKVETFSQGWCCSRSCKCSQEKKNATMKEVYGVEHAHQSKEIQEKFKATMLERHGDTSVARAFKEERNATNREKYGVDHPLQSEAVRERIKYSVLEKHGVEYQVQRVGFQEKAKATNMEKYGVEYYHQSTESKEKRRANKEHTMVEMFPLGWEVLLDKEKFVGFLRGKSRMEAATKLGCSRSLIEKRISEWDLEEFRGIPSSYEVAIEELLVSLGLDFKKNDRTIIAPKELDYVVESHKIAIEFNGLYWHGEQYGRDETYHLEKTKAANAAGYRLIQIFSDEWDQHPDICRDLISKAFGVVGRKIFARKTSLRDVDEQTSTEFLTANHLQGNRRGATLRVGLFLGEELVSLMTFQTKGDKTELLRFANKVGVTVVGGASKMFAHVVQSLPGLLFSYSDRRWFDGAVYHNLGMTLVRETTPGYFYTVGDVRLDRRKFTKAKLVEAGYDPAKTEKQIMEELGFDRVWDCGNWYFEMQ